MIRNAVDRELPEQIGSYVVKPYFIQSKWN